MQFIGIDPGHSGGAVLLDESGRIIDRVAFGKLTEHDTMEWLVEWDNSVACIEAVHSMPKDSVTNSFKFGQHYGFLRGCLTALHIPFHTVTPQAWQKAMQCRTKGDKNVTKAAAQRLWPETKWTHALADAALIAEYGRRTHK